MRDVAALARLARLAPSGFDLIPIFDGGGKIDTLTSSGIVGGSWKE